jgi:hypothetical protein
MGAAKITATAKMTILLSMAPTPVIHLIPYLLALAAHVKRPMAAICHRAKSGKIDVSFTAFSTWLTNRPRAVNVSWSPQRVVSATCTLALEARRSDASARL